MYTVIVDGVVRLDGIDDNKQGTHVNSYSIHRKVLAFRQNKYCH